MYHSHSLRWHFNFDCGRRKNLIADGVAGAETAKTHQSNEILLFGL